MTRETPFSRAAIGSVLPVRGNHLIFTQNDWIFLRIILSAVLVSQLAGHDPKAFVCGTLWQGFKNPVSMKLFSG